MKPPRLALWIHERSLCRSERDAVIGDLLEEFSAFAERDGRQARRWIWQQTLRSLVPNLRRRFRPAAPAEHADRPQRRHPMNGFMIDLRFALRLIRRQPLATGVAFVSLAAGLALNTLLFTLANAVLFRPLPVESPSELAMLMLQRPTGLMHNFSYPDYRELVTGAKLPAGIVAYAPAQATLTGTEAATVVDGESVSGNYFSELGIAVREGRGLAPDDDRRGAAPAVVISERLWRDRFARAAIDGQVISLNGQAFTVIGVAAWPFVGMEVGKAVDFWMPVAHASMLDAGGGSLDRPNTSWLTVVARVRQNEGRDAVRQELDAIVKRAFESRGRRYEPIVLMDGARGDSMLPARLEGGLRVLLTAGALVLLVGCMNVANLQLARTEARRIELAVRAALGARRGQLSRLLMIDAVLLAACAGVAGVAAAALLKDRAASFIALWGQPVSIVVPVDWRVAGAAIALSAAAAVVVSALSISQMLRTHAGQSLQDMRTVAGPKRRIQRLLVTGQFALSMALLTGAVLVSRTIVNLRSTDLGFDAGQVAVVEVSPEMAGISREAAVRYFDDLVTRVSSIGGVEGAAVAHVMPLDFGGSRTSIEIAGYVPQPDEDMELNFLRVTPAYFKTLGIPLLQGRAFDDSDRAGQPRRIIINETMARRFWPDGAIGRFVRFSSQEPFDVEVIGVAADAHYRMVREEARPSFYAPLAQWPSASGVLHARFHGPPNGRIEELRRVVGSVNPAVPVVRAGTLREQMERNIADEKLAGAIGLTLAGATLVLAAVGLYATMAFLVGRRTREIGVRVALGARGADVRQLVLRDAGRLAALGIAGGLALAVWMAHTLRNLLYGVDPLDPISLAGAAIILGSAAMLASWLPAHRASRVDPLAALREP